MPEEQSPQGRQISLIFLSILATFVGVMTGVGAIVFRGLIGLVHNIAFFGNFTFDYNANQLTPPSPWGPWVILVPVIGGMGVVYLVRNYAPEAKGHGVPEVMDAIYYREGRVRTVVAFVKSCASALSIGTGAAIGREGPIIQIGSSVASTLGQIAKLATWQRITLIAAGAGAGIAATFNTPLGGVMFSLELMLPEISSRTFLPVVLATGAATYIGRLAFGLSPAFIVPVEKLPPMTPADIGRVAAAIGLGLLCGLASTAFVKLLAWLEDVFPHNLKNDYLCHAVGMLMVGILMYVLLLVYGNYYVDGVGYGTIQELLQGHMGFVVLLIVLFFAKLLATTISLGSGGSGGIFSPSLFMGATLGGAYAALLNLIIPGLQFSLPEFAIVGMAGIVGGATGAAMTAIVMIFEMTRDYNIIVLVIVAVAISVGLRRLLSPENIYTIKLVARGRHIPKDRHTNMFLVRHAQEVMDDKVKVMPADMLAEQVRRELADEPPQWLVLKDDGRLAGIVHWDEASHWPSMFDAETKLSDIAEKHFVLARNDDILNQVLKRLGRGYGQVAVVVTTDGVPRAEDVAGVVTLENIGRSVLRHFRN